MRRLLSFLRAPVTAVWLIVAAAVYGLVSTAIPQNGYVLPADMAAWRSEHQWLAAAARALGLHDAYSTVPFLAVVMLLLCSVSVCTFDRSRYAVRLTRLARTVPDVDFVRRTHWSISEPASGTDCAALRGLLAGALEELGLSVRVSEHGIRGTSSMWAAWGSAAFHWCLVGLFVSAGVGQLVRWEGAIGIPVGHEITDRSSNYGRLERGPFAPASPASGFTLGVPTMRLDYPVGGGARGHAPHVRITRGGDVVAEGDVYPNHPLVAGSFTLHRGPWGLAVVAALVDGRGTEVARRMLLFDFESTGGSGRLRLEEDVPAELGIDRIRLAIPLDAADSGGFTGDLPSEPRVEVSAVRPNESSTTVLAPGEQHSFAPDALSFKVVDITRYARFTAVNDPSLPFIYLFFICGVAGSVVALAVRPRLVFATVQNTQEGCVVRAVVISRRIDPLFRARAESAVRRIAAQGGEHGSA